MKTLKPVGKIHKTKNKQHSYNITQMQSKRLKDIETLEKQPILQTHNVLINNIKNDCLNHFQDIIMQALNLIGQELEIKKIIDKFVPKNIQIPRDSHPTMETNPKYIHGDRIITGLLNQMSKEIPTEENINDQIVLAVKRILKHVEDKIVWSLSGINQSSAPYIIPKEDNDLADISDIEFETIMGEKRTRQKQWGKPLPKKYNMSKIFEFNIKNKLNRVTSSKRKINRNKGIKQLSKLFTVSQYDNKHIPKLKPL